MSWLRTTKPTQRREKVSLLPVVFAGGAAGGALAGLACGPGVPLCVTVGVYVGGALGALGADYSFGWLF